jgi:hypothetical protein
MALLAMTWLTQAATAEPLPREQVVDAQKNLTWKVKRPGPEDRGTYTWSLEAKAKDHHIDEHNFEPALNQPRPGTGTWFLVDGMGWTMKSVTAGGDGEPRASASHGFDADRPDTLPSGTESEIKAVLITGVATELVESEKDHPSQEVKASAYGKFTIPGGTITAAEVQSGTDKPIRIDPKVGLKNGGRFQGISWGKAKAKWTDPILIELLEIETGHSVVESLYHVAMEISGMGELSWDDVDGIVLDAPDDRSAASIDAAFTGSWIVGATGDYSASLAGGVLTTGGALAGLPWQITMEGASVVRAQLPPAAVPVVQLTYRVPPHLAIPGYTYREILVVDDAAEAEQACCLPAVDGLLGPETEIGAVQLAATGFEDNDLGAVDLANGSELDLAAAGIAGDTLRLFLGGNLASLGSKLEIFFDAVPGGQNRLLGNNPGVDGGGLIRMGDDGSGNGLRFDSGFEADHWLTAFVGPGPGGYRLRASFADLPTQGGGAGAFLGQTIVPSDGSLTGGFNPFGIRAAIDNRNTRGVPAGCAAAALDTVATGIEFAIPLAALGNPTGCIRVTAFVNRPTHDFVSNQVLGPLPPGSCNPGDPRWVSFDAYPGEQHFVVCPAPQAAGVEALEIARSVRIQAWPNPSRGHVQLSFEGDRGGVTQVAVFDLAGRKVKSFGGAFHSGTIDWDGRGDDGRMLPAGVYLARARTVRGTVTAMLLRTR